MGHEGTQKVYIFIILVICGTWMGHETVLKKKLLLQLRDMTSTWMGHENLLNISGEMLKWYTMINWDMNGTWEHDKVIYT